jgi:hypothetical protein
LHRRRWLPLGLALACWLPASAGAELFAPPLPPDSYYEVGGYQLTSGVSFGRQELDPVWGIRFHERNGVVSKAMIMAAGGLLMAAMEPGDQVVTDVSTSTSFERVNVVDSSGTKVGEGFADVTRTTITYRDKTEEERAADRAMMKALGDSLGSLAALPWSTEVILVPDNDDGRLHGGSFQLTVSFGSTFLWFDIGIDGQRWAATVTDEETGMPVKKRFRSFAIPVRMTVSPVAWFLLDAEIRPNLLGMKKDDPSDIDHSHSWRAGVMIGLPFFEYVYARAGVQKTTITGDRPLGTYLELGARF